MGQDALGVDAAHEREVAAELVLSERTIEGHLSNIYAKLQVRSRAELARRFTTGTEPPP